MKKRRLWFFVLAVTVMVSLLLSGCNSGGSGGGGTSGGNNQTTEPPVVETPEVPNTTPNETPDAPRAEAPSGTYIGQFNNGVAEFLGIPYAAPIERWKAPKDVETTTADEIIATEWGPSCIQPDDDVELASKWNQSEDCLQLNIWTKDVSTSGKPVMMFIHGGGAWQGGTWDPLYDGQHFPRALPDGEDVVFITINYRLGIIGSLDLSLLEGYTDEYADAVNLAILDQLQALKWINANIAAFGGDPDNVTIFGQSAGGGACCTLMTMPEATKLFHRAILESGVLLNRQTGPEKSKENSQTVFDILGVTSIEELLAISGEQIRTDFIEPIWDEIGSPQRVSDGRIIPAAGYAELLNGSAKDIDVMIGTTNGEYDFLATDWDNFPEVNAAIADPDYIFGRVRSGQTRGGDSLAVWSVIDDADIVNEYMSLGDDQVMRAMDLYNDINYRQVSIFIAEALLEHNDNVYMYYWEWAPNPESVIALEGEAAEVSPWGRAMHCMEVIFVFGTTERGYEELGGPGDELPADLVKITQMAWYNFAKTGNPNGEGITNWEKYDTTDRYTMMMSDEWTLESDPRSEDRIVLDQKRPG